jgi:DEAD/DEAH box helicase domain-containing protein
MELHHLTPSVNLFLREPLGSFHDKHGCSPDGSQFIALAKMCGERESDGLIADFRAELRRDPEPSETAQLEGLALQAEHMKDPAGASGDDAPFLFQSTDGGELVSRWDMQAHPPDLLITNVSMLSAMLSREVDAPIFERTRKWLENDDSYFYLVLDELHLQRGSAGTEVSHLLRILLDRLGLSRPEHRHKLRILASSASLPDSPPAEADRSATYLWDMFGPFGIDEGSGATRESGREAWLAAIVSGRQIPPKYVGKTRPAAMSALPFIRLLRGSFAEMEPDADRPYARPVSATFPELGCDLHDAWEAVAMELAQSETGPLTSLDSHAYLAT